MSTANQPESNSRAPHQRGDSKPFISVIINTCDRCEALRTLLFSLKRQTYLNFEVVVVVGPTRDNSVKMLAEDFGDRVIVVRCPQFNLSASRNVGLGNAAGEVVAFIDDDAVPCFTWLEQLAQAYSDSCVAGAGGRTYNIMPEVGELQFLRGLFSVLAEQEDVRWGDEPPTRTAVPARHWFPRFHGTNMSYRRDVLFEIDGFDERYEYLFDDADIAARLARTGHRLKQLSDAVVYHAPGSGRNRGKHKYDLNWYCWLRSTVYFAIKNGRPAVGLRAALIGAARAASFLYSRIDGARRQGEIPEDLYKRARRMLFKGWVEGYFQGLFLRRRFPEALRPVEREPIPFLNNDSPRIPSVPPIASEIGLKVSVMVNDCLRVCLLSVGYPPENTHGVSRSTHTLAQGLAELGHEVHVVTAGDRHNVVFRDGAYIHEVNGAVCNRYGTYATNGYQNLAHWLNHSHAVFDKVRSLRINHEIQIVDTPLWNLDGLVTAVSAEVPVAVRVVTSMKQIAAVHGQESDENRLLADLESDLLRMASAIISNSRGTVRTLREIYGLDLEETLHHVAPYGIVPVADEDLSGATEIPQETTVLFVGRLEGRKGILELFEAIPEVLRRAPRTRFQIVGSDNSHADGFRAEHRMDYPSYFKKKYGSCTGQVDFLGFVDEDRLAERYRSCDLFVAPSRYESFGLIFLEAMNFAKPVIGCRAGGPEDIIVDGETGLLVAPQDPRALADAISELVISPAKRDEMGRAGRRRLLDRYSHIAMAEEFVTVYRRILEARSQQGSKLTTAGEHSG